MHLWPTKNLRDSFKLSYLKNLEWNYQRMENQKKQESQNESQSSTQQKLIEDGYSETPKRETGMVVASLCQDLLLLLSCCYCCFCCGACVEEK